MNRQLPCFGNTSFLEVHTSTIVRIALPSVPQHLRCSNQSRFRGRRAHAQALHAYARLERCLLHHDRRICIASLASPCAHVDIRVSPMKRKSQRAAWHRRRFASLQRYIVGIKASGDSCWVDCCRPRCLRLRSPPAIFDSSRRLCCDAAVRAPKGAEACAHLDCHCRQQAVSHKNKPL